MNARVEIKKYLDYGPTRALLELGRQVESSGLDRTLVNLVNIRVSQINGCAYCLDMHTKEARAHGETEQRIYALDAWQETPFFSDRERAALLWAETVTRVAESHVPDGVYEQTRLHFAEEELVALTFEVTAINSWNRLMISFRAPPGTYEPEAAVA